MGSARARRRPTHPGGHAQPGRVDDDRRPAGQGRPRVRSTEARSRCRRAYSRRTRRRTGRHGIDARVPRPDSAARQEGDGGRRLGSRRPTRRNGGARREPTAERRQPRRKPLDPARRAAFDVLRAVSERDAYANLALPAMLRERGITGRDAAFATELTYGTCRSPGPARRGHRPSGGSPDRQDRSGAAGPAAAGHLPAAAHPGRASTPRCRPPSSRPVSNSTRREQVSSTACCAQSPGATNAVLGGGARSGGVARPSRASGVHARPSAMDRAGFRRCAGRRRRGAVGPAGQRR